MPYSVAMVAQLSPGTTTCHWEHPTTAPDAVGAGAETALAQVGTCRLSFAGLAVGSTATAMSPTQVGAWRFTLAPEVESTIVSAVYVPCSWYSVVSVDVPSGSTCKTTRAGTRVGEGVGLAFDSSAIPTTVAIVVKVTVSDMVWVTTTVRASAAAPVPIVYVKVFVS